MTSTISLVDSKMCVLPSEDVKVQTRNYTCHVTVGLHFDSQLPEDDGLIRAEQSDDVILSVLLWWQFPVSQSFGLAPPQISSLICPVAVWR